MKRLLWVDSCLSSAAANRDMKQVKDLEEAEKGLDCRNKSKRKNKYRCK